MIRFIQIIMCLCFLLSSIKAQESKKTWELNKEIYSSATYVARDKITLKNGFKTSLSAVEKVSFKIDPNLIFGMESSDYVSNVNNNSRVIDKSLEFGTIQGSFNVSSIGSANYTIPIATPPGKAGLTPNISIAYNSNAGEGLLGPKWNLSGFSEIKRVGQDFFHDGLSQNVQFDATDNFALNGTRLVLKSGNNGKPNSEYELEVKDFSSIKAFGNSTLPDYFVQETASETKLYFGNSTDSKYQVSTKLPVSTWRLNKIEDVNGNYMEYIYGKTSKGESYIKTIKYTGNSKIGLTPYNEIRFLYQEKEDSHASYLHGYKKHYSLMIRKIQVVAHDKVTREYHFKYSKVNNETHLSEVNLYNGNKEKLNATSVDWYGKSTEFTQHPIMTNFKNKYIGDFNGDGADDYLELSGSDVKVYLNNGSGTFTYAYKRTINRGVFLSGLFVGDYNGDGLDDFASIVIDRCVWEYTKVGHPKIINTCDYYEYCFYENKGESFNLKSKFSNSGDCTCEGNGYGNPSVDFDYNKDVYTGDFNGDGRTDLSIRDKIYLGSAGGSGMKRVDGFPNSDEVTITDIDGNGAQEFAIYDGDFHFYEYGSSGVTNIYNHKFYHSSRFEDFFFADYNGDGLSDLIYKNSSMDWKVKFATGTLVPNNAFSADNSTPLPTNVGAPAKSFPNSDYPLTSEGVILLSDLDGNGINEIIRVYLDANGNANINVYNYQGADNYGISTSSVDCSIAIKNGIHLLNMNDDGQIDIVIPDAKKFVSYREENKMYLVESIMDGLGVKTNINYGRLSKQNSGYYKKAVNATSNPIGRLKSNHLTVVSNFSQVSTLNNNGEINNVNYKYENAYTCRYLGFVGFKKISAENSNGSSVETTNSFSPPFYQGYASNVKTSLNGNLLSESTSEKAVITKSLVGGSSYFIYPDLSTSIDKLNNNTVATNFVYDTNCNLTSKQSTSSDGSYNKVTYSNYLGAGSFRPQTITSEYKHKDDGVKFTATSSYTYHPSKYHLTQSVINVGKANQITTDYKDFDPFGNAQTLTESPLNINAITKTIVYDGTGRFVKSTSDPLGTVNYTYDERTGDVLTYTDIYGNKTTTQYNGWGKPIKTIDYLNNGASSSTRWANSGDPTGTLFVVTSDASNAASSTEYFDYKGHGIKSTLQGFNDIYYSSETTYSDLGQVLGYTNTFDEGGNKLWNTNTYYSNNGRLHTSNLAGGANVTYTYGINSFDVKVNNQITSKEFNADGNISKVTTKIERLAKLVGNFILKTIFFIGFLA